MTKQAIFLLRAVVICLFVGLSAYEAQAGIAIKVRALNPLETEEVAAIRYPLPREITPGDITARHIKFSLPHEDEEAPPKTTFNIEYVEKEARYFIIDEVLLAPREVVTLEVHVRDVWAVDKGYIKGLRQIVEDLMDVPYSPVEAPPSEEDLPEEEVAEPVEEGPDETALALQEEIFKQLDEVMDRQARSSVVMVGVSGHIKAYEKNMDALRQVESDIEMLRYLLLPPEEEPTEGESPEDGTTEAEEDQ